MPQPYSLDDFTTAYAECLLWASLGQDGTSLADNFDLCDISTLAWETIQADCRDFQALAAAPLAGAYLQSRVSYNEAQAGYDFWLTRNGHGSGFWDRGLGPIGEDLASLARTFAGQDPFVSSGEIHL